MMHFRVKLKLKHIHLVVKGLTWLTLPAPVYSTQLSKSPCVIHWAVCKKGQALVNGQPNTTLHLMTWCNTCGTSRSWCNTCSASRTWYNTCSASTSRADATPAAPTPAEPDATPAAPTPAEPDATPAGPDATPAGPVGHTHTAKEPSTLAEKLWDSKEALVQTTNFTNTPSSQTSKDNSLECGREKRWGCSGFEFDSVQNVLPN